MRSILVNIISYKNDNLFKLVDSLKELSSGKNEIIIKAIYQHPRRNKKYSRNDFVFVKMDNNQPPIQMLDITISKNVNYDYFLSLGSSTSIEKDWDDKLINFFEDINFDRVNSGNIISVKDNYADINFMFMRHSWARNIHFPGYLKRLGFNEEVTMRYFGIGCDIVQMQDSPISVDGEYYIDYDYYMPFSVTHNYQEVIDLYEKGYNKYISLNEERHKIFKQITNGNFVKKINNIYNDVPYGNKSIKGRNAHYKKGETYRK
jgi:hypothetical protein